MDQELFRIIFDNVENGIYVADGRGMTLAVNRTFEEMSGIAADEIVGRRLQDLVGPDNYFSGSATLLVLERKAPATATYSTRTGRKLLVKGRPIFGAKGEIRYVINTIWDLTVVSYTREIDADTARDELLSKEDIIAVSEAMVHVVDLALRVADTESTLLLTGETGVGKSLLAKMIHRASSRRNKPFLQINCAAIPEHLIESELFGYEAGAFTGADRKGKPGLFELADGGTVFLDEIAEMPSHAQAKLLGVLHDREFYRVGGRSIKKVDVRLIAATNRELLRLVNDGRFREDLFYRLSVVPIHIPALRERREDIPPLIHFFLARSNQRHNKYQVFSRELIDHLQGLHWKGNVRELENAVERLVVTSSAKKVAGHGQGVSPGEQDLALDSGLTLREQLLIRERQILQKALQRYGTTRRVAAALGISQATAVRHLRKIRCDIASGKSGEF